ncbi:hypothetical protein GCK32_022596, partial [Trichostrongylus colubriformis]
MHANNTFSPNRIFQLYNVAQWSLVLCQSVLSKEVKYSI